MSSLDQYQIPHDPDSQHQLHWIPGNYGKGLVTPDGTLHHWNIPHLDGNPTHRQYIMQAGMGDPYRGKMNLGMFTPFWINPQGGYEIAHQASSDNSHIISQIDPRLRPEYQAWRFGDARSQQRAIDRENMSPVEFERTYAWDEDLKYDHHPATEWVPTHELRKFMEFDRRPNSPDANSTPERWKALKDHINQHGFANAVVLDFNPDTGHAHMSEGNHRTQIALDTGYPYMPVRVYRSRRTSPTQIKVNAIPRPEWADRHSPDGYHWPSDLSPSDIGLPTVPAPNQWGVQSKVAAVALVEGTRTPDESGWADKIVPNLERIPALYSEDLRPAVFVGQPGTHHADLIREFELSPNAIHNWAVIDLEQGLINSSVTMPDEAEEQLREYARSNYGTVFADEVEGPEWTF